MTDPPGDLIRNPKELRSLLAERTLDLRALDLAGFRRWLDMQIARWQTEPVFVQRARIRDLRTAHPVLRDMEKAYRLAERADAATPQAAPLAELDRERHNADKAVAGLMEAIDQADPSLLPSLEAKLGLFITRQQAVEAERAALVESSPERQALLTALSELDAFRSAVGLDREEARLVELQTGHGRGAGRAGTNFEAEALALTRR
ncbi:MAG TPA: hypothetical protein VKD90_19245, partial [Gemmataceae bacterium]|nr:hypothetical protein [Gemmataceae bacterium]